ncbi:MAG: hypothetical protein SFY81_00005, partial [Verrucomicrobiota bacterium]|nr:hypothetical protein [Verrucomicrobiota bacterium]
KTPHPHLNGLRQEPTTPTQSTVTADSKISNPSPEIKTVAKPTAPTQSTAAATKESIALLRKEIHEKALLLGLRFENGKVRYCPAP